MAIAKYWQRGEKIDFLNSTTSTIKNGEVVTLGERIGLQEMISLLDKSER